MSSTPELDACGVVTPDEAGATLRMYFDGSSSVIATSPDEATELLHAYLGDTGMTTEEIDWKELPSDTAQKLWIDPSDGSITGHDDDGSELVSMTVTEQVARFGKGYTGSIDY